MILGGITYDWTDSQIITLAEAKHNLRVEHDLDNAEIQIFIYSAYQEVEGFLNRVLIKQQKEFLLNEKKEEIKFTISQPEAFKQISTITAIATDGTKHIASAKTVAFDGYKVTISALVFDSTIEVSSYEMVIDYEPKLLNDIINQSVYLTITNFYENRNAVIVGTVAKELPMGASHIIQKFKYQLV